MPRKHILGGLSRGSSKCNRKGCDNRYDYVWESPCLNVVENSLFQPLTPRIKRQSQKASNQWSTASRYKESITGSKESKLNVQELFLKVWKLILYKSMSKSEKQLLAFELTIRFEIEGLRKEADPSTSNFFPSGK